MFTRSGKKTVSCVIEELEDEAFDSADAGRDIA